jgi:hypothetical protein
VNLPVMRIAKKPTAPVDVIHEDSGPPLTGDQEQQDSRGVDIDDAQIQEPKDDAFAVGPLLAGRF